MKKVIKKQLIEDIATATDNDRMKVYPSALLDYCNSNGYNCIELDQYEHSYYNATGEAQSFVWSWQRITESG